MSNEVFSDRRVCDECGTVFLYANETTEHIEGEINPLICDEDFEGCYCHYCIDLFYQEISAELKANTESYKTTEI